MKFQCSKSIPDRILVCSLGSIGRRHVRVIKENYPSVEIGCIRSGHGGFAKETKLIDCLFTDFHSAIAWQPDAAIIASPAPFHLEQALILARAGIPLLIEKPIGTGDEPESGWDELMKLSDNLPILVGYVLRYDLCAKYIFNNISSGAWGRVLEADFYCGSWLPDWRDSGDYRNQVSSCRSLGGGALLELSHEIDLAHWFLGGFDVSFGCLQNSGLLHVDVEDQAVLFGQTSDKSLISIRLNFCTRTPRRLIVFSCEKCDFSWDVNMGIITIHEHGKTVKVFEPKSDVSWRYVRQISHFFSCFAGVSRPCCSVSDAITVLKTANRVKYISSNTHF